MSKYISIKKGLDIKLTGIAEKLTSDSQANLYAVKPTDFNGVSPKMVIKVGAHVDAGSALFVDKNNPAVQFCSPVSGEVKEIKRGEKRKILAVVISPDEVQKHKVLTPVSASPEEVIDSICQGGLWPFIKQRPFDVIANPTDNPRDIFITSFNSEPLSADMDFITHGHDMDFKKGIEVLGMLTSGKVYLNTHIEHTASPLFNKASNVELTTFKGPHPSGNVGVQINKISPINKGETVWTLGVLGVTAIGCLFNQAKYDVSRLIALGGDKVHKPRYIKTIAGAQISSITQDRIETEDVRRISGGILTGKKVEDEGFLGFYDTEVIVIAEGNQTEFMGWLMPGTKKFSMSHTFLSYLTPNRKYSLDTNLHGEHRAYVMNQQYERVFPMDIYPVQLIKACLSYNLEKMEALGIYEVAPEDFALCDFVCTSKTEVQDIIRNTLDKAVIDLS